jgi:hypothetical protein
VAITQLLMEVSRIEPDSESKAEFRNTEGDYFSCKKKLTEWPRRLGLESAADFTLQQIQLLALHGRCGLPPWGPAGNRSAEPAFQFDYEVRCAQWAPDTLRLSQRAERLIIVL